jgi:hypothetical protein
MATGGPDKEALSLALRSWGNGLPGAAIPRKRGPETQRGLPVIFGEALFSTNRPLDAVSLGGLNGEAVRNLGA